MNLDEIFLGESEVLTSEVRVLRRSGLDGYCVGLCHLCTEELRPGSANCRSAWPRHSATPHAVRSLAAPRGRLAAEKIKVGKWDESRVVLICLDVYGHVLLQYYIILPNKS